MKISPDFIHTDKLMFTDAGSWNESLAKLVQNLYSDHEHSLHFHDLPG